MRSILRHSLRVTGRAFLSPLIAVLLSLGGAFASAVAEPVPVEATPDFVTEVRPILASFCFKCHGPDPEARKARLRLDVREGALGTVGNGPRAIVPGDATASELVKRILTDDELDLMPPPEVDHPLSEAQKQTLKRWIDAGAEYAPHWAFVPPVAAPLPQVENEDWPQNGIDRFILARLEQEGLVPSPVADPYTLIRRLSLDLVGLPPDPDEADGFAADPSPAAYEVLVDRLLASPRYGERWARRWLDLARYADTNGYEKDRPRSIWPYRDWVIDALNADMAFDQFTIEQLAGDMLPNPSVSQRIATGFHRNTMLNEEGGIDPLEYRFYAMVDRVDTTATTWMGLTMACARCHTHKYDPITQVEYYQFMAFLNNADEPTLLIPDPKTDEARQRAEERIDALVKDLANRFPPPANRRQASPVLTAFDSSAGSRGGVTANGDIAVIGPANAKETFTLHLETDLEAIDALSLSVLAAAEVSEGAGWVLNEIELEAAPLDGSSAARPVTLTEASSGPSKKGFPVKHAFDGDEQTGWTVGEASKPPENATATFRFQEPVGFVGGTRFTVRMIQGRKEAGTIERFRFALSGNVPDPWPESVRRQEHLEAKFEAWLAEQRARLVRWIRLEPQEATANLPYLQIEPHGVVSASGDQTKRDVYQVRYAPPPTGATAVRLQVLSDPELPEGGPGRVYYEGPRGDFFLSNFRLEAGGQPLGLTNASHTFASGKHHAANAIDDDPQSGWSVNGGQGRAHNAVFRLATPLPGSTELDLEMVFEAHYAAGLGRFTLWATTDPGPATASALPDELQLALLRENGSVSTSERDQLLHHFLQTAEELGKERAEIDRLRRELRQSPTTLVLQERPAGNPRPAFWHHRGEFLQPREQVAPGIPEILPNLPASRPRTRLELARWLVSREHPLTARVTVNRQWAAFFGRGLVETPGDFGLQGKLPTFPELLDWLAVEFMEQGWSLKRLHRLIVMSATYRQSSRVSPLLLARDPDNILLARGPRVRLDAELIRDGALSTSGLLSTKTGGPSVFPPQPAGVTTEGTYGPLQWKVSEGEDRYRRGVYTFAKRTAPYAMFATFDGPSGESCTARREVSNTPLQALTLLNDEVFLEASRALARRALAGEGTDLERATLLFRLCLVRPPDPDELDRLLRFVQIWENRLAKTTDTAAALAGESANDVSRIAAWTAAARVLLNLDESVTKS